MAVVYRNRWGRARRGRQFRSWAMGGLIAFLLLFILVEQQIEPTLLLVAAQKADQLAKLAISDAVTKRITQQGIDFDEIVITEKDREGTIQALNSNFKEYTRIVGESTSRIQNRLKEFEEENVTVTIPLLVATKNAFLEHYGPEIPVSFVPIGAVKTILETDLKEAGITWSWPRFPCTQRWTCAS